MFHNEGPVEAKATLGESFKEYVDTPAGGLPALPAGESSTGFANATTEQLDLGSQAGVVESTVPLAMQTPHGYEPVDLDLKEAGAGFEPAFSPGAVRIPRNLAAGTELSELGIKITPVASNGTALSGSEGGKDGTGVFYANTAVDSDTVMKPSTLGVEASTVIRSEASPEAFYYHLTLPDGATLRGAPGATGALQLVKEGTVIAFLPAPHATDAEGAQVPVSMSVTGGDTLVVTVARTTGSYRYPILLDPEIEVAQSNVVPGNWNFHEFDGYEYGSETGRLWMHHVANGFPQDDYGVWDEVTQGVTRIYDVYTNGELNPNYGGQLPSYLEAYIAISAKSGGIEEKVSFSEAPYYATYACAYRYTCTNEAGSSENEALIEINTKQTSAGISETHFSLEANVFSTFIAENREFHSEASWSTSPEINTGPEVLKNAVGSGWLSPHVGPSTGAIEFDTHDDGLGVEGTSVEYYNSAGQWEPFASTAFATTSECKGIQCNQYENEHEQYNELVNAHGEHLPDGSDRIRATAHSAMPDTNSDEHGEGETTAKVDSLPPTNITLSGLTPVGTSGKEYILGERATDVTASATDNLSGIWRFELGIAGTEITPARGATECKTGPCTGSDSWILHGRELGVGSHEVTVYAYDNAGNRAEAEFTVKVYASKPVAAGPGFVNLESGDFALEATDVSLSGGEGELALSRHYDSTMPTAGGEGPLGPQWSVSLADEPQQLEVLQYEAGVELIGPAGNALFKPKTGGGLEAPEGDGNLELSYDPTYSPGVPAYLLKDAKQGTTTVFTQPTHTSRWLPISVLSPASAGNTSVEYESVEVKTGVWAARPALELAPHTAGVACSKASLVKGCRALEFVYDKAGEPNEATGEAEKEWGGYPNRLKEVIAIAYNPGTDTMGRPAVAAYTYDKLGRLRAVWNPSITPALKTTYGYDAEGHVTALTPPGEETWAFTYGAATAETPAGRLLKFTQAPAKAAPWNGEPTTNTETPKLTGTPAVGVRMAVSTGTWSNNPVSYGYQWEDCTSEVLACIPIAGAVNGNYTPVAQDVGYTLVVKVTAINGDGATTVRSAASAKVASPATNSFTAISCIPASTDCVASDTAGGALYTMNLSASTESSWQAWSGPNTGPSQAVACPSTSLCVLADGKEAAGGALFYATALGGSFHTAVTPSYGVDAISCPATSLCVEGQDANGYFRYATTPASESWTLEDQGSGAAKSVSCVSTSFCVIAKSTGAVLVATTTSQIKSEAWRETSVDGSTALSGVGCSATTSCVAVDGAGNALALAIEANGATKATKTDIDGTNALTSVSCSGATCVTVDGVGNVFTSTNSGVSWTKSYALGQHLTSVSCASTTLCATVDTAGSVISFNPAGSAKPITTTPGKPVEGGVVAPQPGSTVEYRVALSGAGLPNLTSAEAKKWGQTNDLPFEAGAVFPPDSPQGWPAASYTRASIYYVDDQMRLVNVATPTGGVSTQEYNESNDVIRSLSAANRATALAGSAPETVAAELESRNEYNSEGELANSWGPLHKVRLAKGKSGGTEEALARNHELYFYDEGDEPYAQEHGEKYELATKTIDGAELADKEEYDKRTTVTAYGGQEGLGWKLRKPTSVTVDPTSLDLTTTTTYEEATGNVLTVATPGAPGKQHPNSDYYLATFGAKGEAAGDLNEARGLAIAANSDVWVTDTNNGRLEEFSSSGTFVEAMGWHVNESGKEELEICTKTCRRGSEGTGQGQFDHPRAIAIASGDMYVVEAGSDRVQVYSEAGAYVGAFGKAGTGAGEMTEPSGITIPSPGTVWVTDTKSSRLEEFKTSTSGPFSASFVRAVGFGVENGEAKFETCATSCKAGISGASVGEFTEPAQIASYQSKLYVAGHQSADITVLNEKGESPTTFGTHGKGTGELEAPTGIAADTSNGSILVADDDNDRVLDYTPGGQFVSEFGTAGEGTGQFKESYGVTAAAAGGVYVVDHDLDRVSKWWPQSDVGNPLAHTKKTIYYTEAANASYPECGGHVEWQGLVCQTRPEAQPEITGTPSLPITTITYDMWDQAERTTEEFPAVPPRAAVTRTKVTTFEPSGRPTRTELTSSVGQPVPTATISYNSANGTVEKETATINKAEHTIVSTYNTLGALETYTDGSGENTAHYTYDIDGRISSIADSADAGTGEQKYTYSTSTGELEKLEDSSAHVFEAAYNSAGDMTSETYPDGMVASTTYDPTGAATSVAYKKTSDCSPECVLYTDSDTASIHGETLEQTSSLAKSVATYDETGRLLSMQETPAGEGCKTRVYTYDEEGNRLSQSEYEPGTGGACATEHGSQTLHEYTTATDLADPGVDYDSFGNITTLPAADGGGTETKAAFYVNNQAYTEAQGSTADAYTLDPADRTFQTTSGTTTSTSHYDGPGNALSWTSQTGGGWARDIPGIGGTLAAVQTSTTAPILQIHNLAGQTVATIGDSPTETKLLSTHNPTEFGASQPAEKAPEYGWLGQGLGSEFPSGSVVEDGSTYIPLIGKPLQSAPTDVTYAPNEIGEFTDAQPPWAEENAVAISEKGIAEAEEARKAAEAAEAAGGGGGAGAEEIVVGTSEDEDGDGAQIASAGCPNYKVVVTSGQNEACTGSGKLIVDWEEVGIGDSGPVVHASVKAVTVQHGATLRITVGQYGPDLPEGAKYVDSGKIPGGRTFSDQNTYTLEVGDELVFQLEEEYKGKISYGRVVLGVAGG